LTYTPTIYPEAFYVNVLDGMPGSLSFVSNTATGPTYEPDTAMVNRVNNLFTANFSATPAVLEVAPAAPNSSSLTGGSATWQTTSGSFSWTYDLISTDPAYHKLILAFNGTLPSMVGVAPAGWVLRERGWQVETVPVSGKVTASGFYDTDDPSGIDSIPFNRHPIFIVPFFGNYTTTNGLTITPTNPTVTGQTVSNALVTVTLPKPLNPNQTLVGMTLLVASTAGSGVLAITDTPNTVLHGTSVSASTNSTGQITGFTLIIPFSSAAQGLAGGGSGQIIPGKSYNFTFTLEQTLTYLSGNAMVTGTVTICSGSCTIAVPDDSVGPNITEAVMTAATGGVSYFSPYMGVTYFMGSVNVTVNATDPEGVNATAFPVTIPGVGVASGAVSGSNPWVNTFNLGVYNNVLGAVSASYVTVTNTDSAGAHSSTAYVTASGGSGEVAFCSLAAAALHTTGSIVAGGPYPIVWTIPMPPGLITSFVLGAWPDGYGPWSGPGTYSTGIYTLPSLDAAGSSWSASGGAVTVLNVGGNSTRITVTNGLNIGFNFPADPVDGDGATVYATNDYGCKITTAVGVTALPILQCTSSYTYPTGGDRGCCFLAGTPVAMADGSSKPIEIVEVGDEVVNYDVDLKFLGTGTVEALNSPVRDHINHLILADDSTLDMTDDHPLFTGGGWRSLDPAATLRVYEMEVELLNEGDAVLALDENFIQISSITRESGSFKTYTLKRVTNNPNFFANGFLAHNCGGG
jgi:hypothetical protein